MAPEMDESFKERYPSRMINSANLLTDLKAILRRLSDDIRERCNQVPEIETKLKAEHRDAKNKGRTAQTFLAWQDEVITRTSSAWILACVFIRFMEDNGLIEDTYLSGPGEKLQEARDNYTLYFKSHPRETDREYLIHVFKTVSKLPGVSGLFDEKHNRLWRIGPTGDGGRMLIEFFQQIDGETGDLVHNFSDPEWDTRFLGDLYQDLSEDIRKKYALLQTPEFVEEFILDRTLTPAIETFGLKEVRLIDPTCGSGHFLIGAFHRLLSLWQKQEPETNERELVRRSIDAVYGVDINPQATAIAYFRLLVAALKASYIGKLKNAPGFKIHLATGDSLLHGPRPDNAGLRDGNLLGEDPIAYVYETEDADKLKLYLGQQYHAVVGNPPYINVKDNALNKAYRERFGSCHRQYSLVCPFLERFFDIAVSNKNGSSVGYIGVITANSFMKREFGKKLIEKYIPKWDLTHIIDTSGAYLPGHGTPTVILFGRNQLPVSNKIRAVMGIKGEPGTPENPAKGAVWSAIERQTDLKGSESDFLSVDDTDREQFHKHPWSLGGGGATDLLNLVSDLSETKLNQFVSSIGFMQDTHADEAFVHSSQFVSRFNLIENFKHQIRGENIRDWQNESDEKILFPYDDEVIQWEHFPVHPNWFWFWSLRTNLWGRSTFGGKSYKKSNRKWFDYHQFPVERFKSEFQISFAFIATHGHFLFNNKPVVFNRSAPIISFKKKYNQETIIPLLGFLNSSTALFWGRQTFFPKGGFASGKWEERLEWDGTKLKRFPIPDEKPIDLSKKLDALGKQCTEFFPSNIVKNQVPTKQIIDDISNQFLKNRETMIALQEELDWQCYNFYKISAEKLWMQKSEDVSRVKLGERAFEIVMARKMASGELETAWFDRHGSTPVTEIPAHWPQDYSNLVQRRIDLIELDKNIRLIEQPEYKRRWAMEPWDKQVKSALEQWLLNRLEFTLSGRDLMAETDPQPPTKEPRLLSCAQLADMLRADENFQQVAELYKGRPDFEVSKLVNDLVGNECVPFLPILRYNPSGLRKRQDWENTWVLQRKEDAILARSELDKNHPDYLSSEEAERLVKQSIGEIAVPPPYKTKDFAKTSFWKLRGKLDVPKERFISYPGLERENEQSLIITWAGWDHLQQAQALSAYIEEAKNLGWPENRLIPMLAGLLELLPWLRQWHNEKNPIYGIGMGAFFADYVEGQARELGKSVEDLKKWKPER